MSIADCPKCHSTQARRIAAETILQKISRRLGLYPWECRLCKARFLLKDRGHAGSGGRASRGDGMGGVPAEGGVTGD